MPYMYYVFNQAQTKAAFKIHIGSILLKKKHPSDL